MKSIKAITKKEIQSYLHNPAAYIVLIVFLLLWEYLFFKNIFLVGEASLRGLYDFVPWLSLILIPAATMGTFAKEKDDRTLELLLTHPIKEMELVLGKYLGALGFVSAALLFTIPLALSFSKYGDLDWGVYFGQFLGSFLFVASLVSLGLFASSLLTNQIAALLVTAVGGLGFILIGTEFVTASLPLEVAPLLDRLSLASHLRSVSRGVIDMRDLIYFGSFVSVFLSLTRLQLLKRRYGNKKIRYAQYQLSVMIFIALVLLLNMIGDRIAGRWDLTQNKIYTLSDSTKEILANLGDEVDITLYASAKLPAQYGPLLRSVKDTLQDYANAGQGKVLISIKDPSRGTDIEQEAVTAGVQEVRFNVIGQEEFQVKTGYFGLAVKHGEESEVIPFIQDASDLEYQLTTFIWKLMAEDKKVIGFMAGNGEKSLSMDYTYLYSELLKQFEVKTVELDFENEEDPVTEIDSDIDVLVIAGPTSSYDENYTKAVRDFLASGKSVFLMSDGFVISPELQYAGQTESNIGEFFSDVGIRLDKNVLYDLKSHDTLRFSTGIFSYLLPYPLWIQALPGGEFSPATHEIEYVTIPWGSSITVDEGLEETGYKVNRILTTSPYSGEQLETLSLDPEQEFSQENLAQRTVAVAVTAIPGVGGKVFEKMIFVGDSDYLSDPYIQGSPQNLVFGVNALSWLSGDVSLADIRIKAFNFSKLQFESEQQAQKLKYGNMVTAFVVPAVFGVVVMARRKSKSKKKYSG